jgi:hypothetical protein
MGRMLTLKQVAGIAASLNTDGNAHPNIKDIEVEFLLRIRNLNPDKPGTELISPEMLQKILKDISEGVKKLRDYFKKRKLTVVPYCVEWHNMKYRKPLNEFEADAYIAGPGYPTFGVFFVTDKDDLMQVQYMEKRDSVVENTTSNNDRLHIKGIEDGTISKDVTDKRIKNRLKPLKNNIERNIKRLENKDNNE